MGVLGGSKGEVLEGQESMPEAAFGGLIVECGGEGGEGEACGALCPGEGGAGLGRGERGSGEGVFRLIDLAGCPGADGNEEVRFGGEDLVGEEAGGGVGHVGLRESYSLQAAVQSLQDPGADRLLDHQHHSGGGISERGRAAGSLYEPGETGELVRDLGPVLAHRVARLAAILPIRGLHGGRE